MGQSHFYTGSGTGPTQILDSIYILCNNGWKLHTSVGNCKVNNGIILESITTNYANVHRIPLNTVFFLLPLVFPIMSDECVCIMYETLGIIIRKIAIV